MPGCSQDERRWQETVRGCDMRNTVTPLFFPAPAEQLRGARMSPWGCFGVAADPSPKHFLRPQTRQRGLAVQLWHSSAAQHPPVSRGLSRVFHPFYSKKTASRCKQGQSRGVGSASTPRQRQPDSFLVPAAPVHGSSHVCPCYFSAVSLFDRTDDI